MIQMTAYSESDPAGRPSTRARTASEATEIGWLSANALSHLGMVAVGVNGAAGHHQREQPEHAQHPHHLRVAELGGDRGAQPRKA